MLFHLSIFFLFSHDTTWQSITGENHCGQASKDRAHGRQAGHMQSADDVRSRLYLSGSGTGGTSTICHGEKIMNGLIWNEKRYRLRSQCPTISFVLFFCLPRVWEENTAPSHTYTDMKDRWARRSLRVHEALDVFFLNVGILFIGPAEVQVD